MKHIKNFRMFEAADADSAHVDKDVKKALQKKLKELERSKSARENAWKKSNYPSPSAYATKYKSDIKKMDLEIKDLKSKIEKIK